MTAIWPTDEKIGWSMRAGVGFVLGLFFILFLPLIFNSLEIGSVSGNLTSILLSLAVLLSLIAMARRKEPSEEEIPEQGVQLTLEESIQRASDMRQRVVEKPEYQDEYSENEYSEENLLEEEFPEEYEYHEADSEDEKVSEEPIGEHEESAYAEEEFYDDEEDSSEDEKLVLVPDDKPDQKPESAPLRVAEPVKTETSPSPTEYEEEMDRPFWLEEETEKKPGFKNWDLVILLLLSGISSVFLYVNPLNDTILNTAFFIILLFTLGYAGLNLIFPDRSRVSSSKTMLSAVIIAIILFVIAFLAWSNGLLPDVPSYLIGIIFIATVIIVAGIFLRKQRMGEAPVEEVEENAEDISTETIPTKEETITEPLPFEEAVQKEEPVKEESSDYDTLDNDTLNVEEKPVLVPDEKPEEKPSPAGKTIGIVDDKKVDKKPPTYKPGNYYTDIILIVVLTLLTAAFVVIPPLNKTFIRTILGILLVLFIPGYSLIAALFPKWGDLDGIERTALSFGLSIAVTPLIGLGLNYTPWGIRLDPILISLTIFTMVMCIIAYLRRTRLPERERFFVPFAGFIRDIKGSFKNESKTERILSVILILSIVLAITTTAHIIVKPKEGEKFTEFYILGPNGTASDYPTNLTTNQQGSVIIGVVNHEYATKNYQLVVTLGNQTIKNETITLNNGQKREIPFNFTAGSAGEKKMEFSLYKLPDQDTAYRSLHLWLNITG